MIKKRLATAIAAVAEYRIAPPAEAQLNSKGELLLYGIIGDWWDELDAATVVRDLERASGSDEIVVRVHSDGGNIVDGLAIYNALRDSDRRVVAYVDGIAASMASAVVCAADVVRMPRNSLLMIHKAHLACWGNADELRDYADQLEILETSVLECYARKASMSVDEFRDMISDGKNHWFTADQALELGICDEIIDDVAVAASAAPEDFHNPPASLWAALVDDSNAAAAANTLRNEDMDKFLIKSQGGIAFAAAITAALAAAFGEDVDAAIGKLGSINIDNLSDILVGKAEASQEELTAIGAAMGVQEETPYVARPAAPVFTLVDDDALNERVQAAVSEERARSAEMRSLGSRYGLADDMVDGFIRDGVSVAEARSQALDAVAARTSAAQPAPGVRVSSSGAEALRSAMTQAIMHRANVGESNLDDSAHEFVHMSLIDMARAHLRLNGVDVSRKSNTEIAAQALQSTSDFPAILADVANKSLRMGYEAAPRVFTRFCRRVTAADFKAINRAQIGSGGGTLPKVNEGGEVKRGKLLDGKESYALETFAEIIPITRKTMINDDLDALSRLPMILGGQAAETESDVVWKLLTTGANGVTMGDGNAVFHASHNNTGGGAISVAGLNTGRKTMRTQKKLDEKTPLNLAPAFLIVPAEIETTAQQFVAEIQPTQGGEVNPFAGSLELLVEPRLDANSTARWYLSASPNRIDTIEYCYLEGEEGVYMETRTGFDVEGMEMKARMDFGAGVIDYRGLYRSSGS